MANHFQNIKDYENDKGNDRALVERNQSNEEANTSDKAVEKSAAPRREKPTVLTAIDLAEVTLLKNRPFYFRPSFLLLAVLPILLGSLYFSLLATDRYVSHAQMTIRAADGGGSNVLSGLIGAVGGSSTASIEGHIVRDYILSRDMVRELQDLIDLRTIYIDPEADYISRLAVDATMEELYYYFSNYRVGVVYDTTTQIIDLSVEAFTPEVAQQIAETIVVLCDRLVDQIAERSRSDAVLFSNAEMARAEKRIEEARIALSDFRNKYGELDPASSAAAFGGIVIGLEAELARAQTELASLRSYLRNDSAQVSGVRARVNALKNQLKQERKRLTGTDKDETFVPLLEEYERLKIEDEFSKEAYRAASTSLELARVEASRKHLYLVPFVEPSLPDEALQPERGKMILTVIACSLLIYGLFSLLSAAIREHARL